MNLVSIAFLIVVGEIATFTEIFVLNVAAMPGALIGGRPRQGGTPRFLVGLLVATIGQSLVKLTYTAFIVNWTFLAIAHKGVGRFIWIVSFLAVAIPICWTVFAASREARQDGVFRLQDIQLDALCGTMCITLAGFFVFVFDPGVMHSIYGWIPYISP